MIKITIESIKEHLIPKGWKKSEPSENSIYKSSDGRYELNYWDEATLCDKNGYGWMIIIDNSKHESLACCDVEYIEQIFALIDIYKDY